MLLNIGIGIVLFFVTTCIHAGGMLLVMRRFRQREGRFPAASNREKMVLISRVIVQMFLVATVEIGAWAVTYLLLGAIEGAERALYFSAVTFTTLGYGDIVLGEQWRLLGGFEAANGIIMFGWSTALVMAAVQRVYLGR
jgi:hypothetical protein